MENIKLTRELVKEIYDNCLYTGKKESRPLIVEALEQTHYFSPSSILMHTHEIAELLLCLPDLTSPKNLKELVSTQEKTIWGTIFDLEKLLALGKATNYIVYLYESNFEGYKIGNVEIIATTNLQYLEHPKNYTLKNNKH